MNYSVTRRIQNRNTYRKSKRAIFPNVCISVVLHQTLKIPNLSFGVTNQIAHSSEYNKSMRSRWENCQPCWAGSKQFWPEYRQRAPDYSMCCKARWSGCGEQKNKRVPYRSQARWETSQTWVIATERSQRKRGGGVWDRPVRVTTPLPGNNRSHIHLLTRWP